MPLDNQVPQAFGPCTLAKLLGVSRATAYRVTDAEKLAITVGKRKIILKPTYEEWIRSKNNERLKFDVPNKNDNEIYPNRRHGQVQLIERRYLKQDDHCTATCFDETTRLDTRDRKGEQK